MDVARDGIALYSYDDKELHTPKPKTPEQALAMAKEYFEEWMPAASGMLETAFFSRQQGRLKEAAFLTHQAAVRPYHCGLLVCTLYISLVHKFEFLRTHDERIDMI